MRNTTIEFTFDNFINEDTAYFVRDYIANIMFAKDAQMLPERIGERKQFEFYKNIQNNTGNSYYIKMTFKVNLENKNEFLKLVDEIFTEESRLMYTYINYNQMSPENIEIKIKG
jgi:hypothetical protein